MAKSDYLFYRDRLRLLKPTAVKRENERVAALFNSDHISSSRRYFMNGIEIGGNGTITFINNGRCKVRLGNSGVCYVAGAATSAYGSIEDLKTEGCPTDIFLWELSGSYTSAEFEIAARNWFWSPHWDERTGSGVDDTLGSIAFSGYPAAVWPQLDGESANNHNRDKEPIGKGPLSTYEWTRAGESGYRAFPPLLQESDYLPAAAASSRRNVGSNYKYKDMVLLNSSSLPSMFFNLSSANVVQLGVDTHTLRYESYDSSLKNSKLTIGNTAISNALPVVLIELVGGGGGGGSGSDWLVGTARRGGGGGGGGYWLGLCYLPNSSTFSLEVGSGGTGGQGSSGGRGNPGKAGGKTKLVGPLWTITVNGGNGGGAGISNGTGKGEGAGGSGGTIAEISADGVKELVRKGGLSGSDGLFGEREVIVPTGGSYSNTISSLFLNSKILLSNASSSFVPATTTAIIETYHNSYSINRKVYSEAGFGGLSYGAVDLLNLWAQLSINNSPIAFPARADSVTQTPTFNWTILFGNRNGEVSSSFTTGRSLLGCGGSGSAKGKGDLPNNGLQGGDGRARVWYATWGDLPT